MKKRQWRRERDELLGGFNRWLVEERGLAATTVSNYVGQAKRLLAHLPAPLAVSLAHLDPPAIIAIVAKDIANGGNRQTARTRTGALRVFLRFLYIRGAILTPLADAVPKVANWHFADIPRFLPAGHVDVLLHAHDRTDPGAVRNHAMLMTLARLGLRAGEVAALRLDDVDWRHGGIAVRSKGPGIDQLPLPHDVGTALAEYVFKARPKCDSENLFVSVSPPYRTVTRHAVANMVYRASGRAGLPPFRPHRMRHTLASDLLRAGSSLVEIGQVLRHRTMMQTATYAKVDFVSLSELARPWPGRSR